MPYNIKNFFLFSLLIVLFTAVSTKAQPNTLNDGLVGYWKFDTVSANTTPDSSTNNNTGVLLNGPTLVPGKFGNALSFDNPVTGSAVETTKPFGSSTWSVSLWINAANPIPSAAPYNNILSFFSTDPSRQMLCIQKDGVYMYLTRIVNYSFDLNPGWHHIVITYDGTYLTAVVDNTFTGSITLNNVLLSTTAKRRIGRANSAIHNFKGLIDEVRLYNRRLSNIEIAILYNPVNANIAAQALSITKTWPLASLPSWTAYSHIEITAAKKAWCRASNSINQTYENMPFKFNELASTKLNLNVLNLEPGSNLTYYVKCMDTLGNFTQNDLVVNVVVDKDLVGPEILEVGTSAVRDTTADIVWSTTEPATSRVELTGLGITGVAVSNDESYGYPHAQLLTGLTPNTTYSYRVFSKDRAGNETASAQYSFTTRGTAARTFYIAPNGKDTNDGLTVNTAFATFEKARDVIRTIRPLPKGGVQVLFKGGVYPRTTSFTLTAIDSGTIDAPIQYRAYNNEEVRITGGREVTAFFTPIVKNSAAYNRLSPTIRDNVVQVKLNAPGLGIIDYGQRLNSGAYLRTGYSPLALFFQDNPMTLARWPNKNPLDLYSELSTVAAVPDPTQTFIPIDTRPSGWQSFTDIWVHGNWFFNHRHSVLKVTSIQKDASGKYLITAPGDPTGMKPNRPFFYMNVLEELDTPGEWYLDRSDPNNVTLYFYPPAPITAGRSYVSIANDLVILRGAKNIVFSGLILENARGKGVITDRDSANNIFENVIIRNVSVGANIAGKNNGFWGSKIYNTEDNGVVLYGGKTLTLEGGYNYVENCELYNNATLNKSYRAAVNMTGTDVHITTDPLGPSNGVNNRVRFNKIHDLPHFGVVLSGNNYLVDSNEIYGVCMETIDCGAIYFSADNVKQGSLIRYNYIHHIYGFDFEKINKLNAVGLYIDNDQNNNHLYGNIIDHVDVGLLENGGRDNFFENNLVSNTDEPMHVNAAGMNVTAKFFRIPIANISNTSPVEVTTIRPHGNNFAYEYKPNVSETVRLSDVATELGLNGNWEFEIVNDSRMRLLGTIASGEYTGGGYLIQKEDFLQNLAEVNYTNPPYSKYYPRMTRATLEVDDAEPKGNRYERNAFYANTIQDLNKMYVDAKTNLNNRNAEITRKYIQFSPSNLTNVSFYFNSLKDYNLTAVYAAGVKPIPINQIGLKTALPQPIVGPSPPAQIRLVQ